MTRLHRWAALAALSILGLSAALTLFLLLRIPIPLSPG